MTQAFNLSQFANNVDTSGKAILTSGQAVTGTLPVANGGTGQATLSSGAVILGNGTLGVTTVSPATSGNLLYANGSAWVSQTPAFGVNIKYFTTTTTWTVPAGVNTAVVWVWGGAGGSANNSAGTTRKYGGYGGYIAGFLSGISGTLSISVGAGGTNSTGNYVIGAAGQASSVTQGATTYISATGGTGGDLANYPYYNGTDGVGSLGTGVTRIRLLSGVENISIANPQSGLSSGQGNTIWSTSYSSAPGTRFDANGTSGNGMGGAVIIQY